MNWILNKIKKILPGKKKSLDIIKKMLGKNAKSV